MRDWLDSLAEYRAKGVLVLGPDPFAANDNREVVAVYPPDFRSEGIALAVSEAYGAQWRVNGGSLVAFKNLAGAAAGHEAWVTDCLGRGVLSVVRAEIPMPFGQGFECFVFGARQFSDKKEPSALVWSAMCVWPLIKEHIVAPHFGISPREREILIAMAQGLTAKDAGKRLGCAERTVTYHLTNLMVKLKADNRAAVIQRACSLGLV
jgi:DNA-binding CsgD family transcriptional regulator